MILTANESGGVKAREIGTWGLHCKAACIAVAVLGTSAVTFPALAQSGRIMLNAPGSTNEHLSEGCTRLEAPKAIGEAFGRWIWPIILWLIQDYPAARLAGSKPGGMRTRPLLMRVMQTSLRKMALVDIHFCRA